MGKENEKAEQATTLKTESTNLGTKDEHVSCQALALAMTEDAFREVEMYGTHSYHFCKPLPPLQKITRLEVGV